jgi:cytochrome P450
MANLHNVHNDRVYWNDPDQFRPERFLDKNNGIIKHAAFMPFSVGNLKIQTPNVLG